METKRPGPNLQMRIGPSWKSLIDDLAHQERRSKTTVVEAAIGQYDPKAIVFVPTDDQRAWLEDRATGKGMVMNQYLGNVVEWAMKAEAKKKAEVPK